MTKASFELAEMHWLMDVLQSIDVGLVILDRDYKIQLWNGFMENHSGIRPEEIHDKSLFESFHDISETWFRRKSEPVFELKTRAFTIWEQRPYLFKFKNYRPITGRASTMYQNSTIIPLESVDGNVKHICLIIYDVTDIAVNQEDLTKANGNLAYLSQTDRLTELFNRGFWEEEFNREHKRCIRTNNPSSLVMLDIDHFKKVNDTYGHQAGDEVIRMLSSMIRQTARETDICGRYGGEEFTILLVDADATAATHFAERLRKKVDALTVNTNEHDIKFTISSGIAEYSINFKKHTQWIEAADKALYHSKENGRNRTTIFENK
jgi:diguanylate cyclase